jgi:hypothetical protein
MSKHRIQYLIFAAARITLPLLAMWACGGEAPDVEMNGGYNRIVGPGAFALTGNESLAGGWDRLAEVTGLIYSHRDAIETDDGDAIQFNAGAYLELQPDARGIAAQCHNSDGVGGCEYDSGYIFSSWVANQEWGNVQILAHECMHLMLFQATGDADAQHEHSELFVDLTRQIADEWVSSQAQE